MALDKSVAFNEIGICDGSIISVIDILKERKAKIAHIIVDEFIESFGVIAPGITLFLDDNHIVIDEEILNSYCMDLDEYFNDILERYDAAISFSSIYESSEYFKNNRVISISVNDTEYSDGRNHQLIVVCELNKYSPTKQIVKLYPNIKKYITLLTLCE